MPQNPKSTTTTTFANTGLSSPILKKLERQGYAHPTPIQAGAIPPILAGKDVVGLAQTGTGKTAAFTLPLLQRVDAAIQRDSGHENIKRAIRVLVLTPTRELAAQVDKAVRNYGENLTTRSACVVGGVPLRQQIKPLKQGVDILVATPGRLEDILSQKIITLNWIETVVLDEADQMLDIGFMPAIKRILALTPKDRQTLLFSATMPRQIRELSSKYMKKPIEISVSPQSRTADNVSQSVMFIGQPDKTKAAIALLKTYKGKRAILFSRTKRGCDRIAKRLNANGLSAQAIHGNRSQNQRTRTLAAFRAGEVDILVATDVAARGIDIPGVELVLNFDLPQVAESYVHRIGRTARAGKSGTAIAFCNPDENTMLKDIEKIIKQRIPVRRDDGKVEAEPEWDPNKNPNAERTFDHTKHRDTETYVRECHQGSQNRGSQNRGSQNRGSQNRGKGNQSKTSQSKGSGGKRRARKSDPNFRKNSHNPHAGDKGLKQKHMEQRAMGVEPSQAKPKDQSKGTGAKSMAKPDSKKRQTAQQGKNPTKKPRRNRPGSRARRRHRLERPQRGGNH